MKRIIEGKTFNTETAEFVCQVPCSAYPGDFGWHDTGLYQSPKGRFFLAGRGNARSMWHRAVGNAFAPGEGIRLISTEEALSIASDAGVDQERLESLGFTIEEG